MTNTMLFFEYSFLSLTLTGFLLVVGILLGIIIFQAITRYLRKKRIIANINKQFDGKILPMESDSVSISNIAHSFSKGSPYNTPIDWGDDDSPAATHAYSSAGTFNVKVTGK